MPLLPPTATALFPTGVERVTHLYTQHGDAISQVRRDTLEADIEETALQFFTLGIAARGGPGG